MRKLLAGIALFLFGLCAYAQNQIFPVSGVVTINCSGGTNSVKVIVNAAVTSVVLTNPTPGQLVTILFQQDATGHAVAFGGNIAGTPSVSSTANAATVITLQFDSTANTWNQESGGGGGTLPTSLTALGTFTISPAGCGTMLNCLQLVDDNSTDNCGTPLTTFLAAINAYAGPGEPQLVITGSGLGKAYKFATAGCHLEFDIPTIIHDFATINFAQPATTANGVQFSPNNLAAQAAIPKFEWDGGVFTGGANLTNSVFECEPFTTNCVIHNVEFHNTGAGHATGGVCTNWSVLFDPNVFEGTVAYTQWDQSDGVVGRCAYFNNGATGENTIFFSHNTLGGGQGTVVPPSECANVGIFEGGYYGAISFNNLYGFNADIRTIGVGTRIDHNTLDSAECTLSAVNAVIQYGATGTANAVLQHSIEQNNVEGGHVSFLVAKAGDTGASTISDTLITGNQASNSGGGTPMGTVDSSPCSISNVNAGTACYQDKNVAMATGNPGNGWCVGTVCGQFFGSAEAANLTGQVVVSTPYGTNWLVTCSVVLTQAATTSSTLPSCAIGWTDFSKSTAQSVLVSPTWSSGGTGCSGSTTNTVGNSCQGSTTAFAKATTNITVTTAGYTSSGATPMQYQVLVQVIGRP